MDEIKPEDESKLDYKALIKKSSWTYKVKHWWECNAALLSCGIDPIKTPIIKVNSFLEYEGNPFYTDGRILEAEKRHFLIFDAISCGELKIKNIVPPDYTDPSSVYLLNPVEFIQWLKIKELSYPPEFDEEVRTLSRCKECVQQEKPENIFLEHDLLVSNKKTEECVIQDEPQNTVPEHGISTSNEKVEGWVKIAEHFELTVRTLQRWKNKYKSLPIKKVGGRVYAYKDELDKWVLDFKF